jgi:hypothetical protein
MIDGDALMRSADANPSAAQSDERSSFGSESQHVRTRHPSNWAWSTAHNQYDWMDSHTFSGDLSPL